MSRLTHRFTRLTLSFALTILVALGAALPVFAADTITQVLTGGTRTASVANLTLGALTYAHANQTNTGNMTLTADDSTASGAGWNVTILSSSFAYTGANGGSAIPAVNFSITTANAPAMTAGQAVDVTNGPMVPASASTGTLDSAHKVIQANAGYGLGSYTQDLAVSLVVPGQSRAGTYTGSLTTTISSAP
jgi:WxL domain surface cell wall-binding